MNMFTGLTQKLFSKAWNRTLETITSRKKQFFSLCSKQYTIFFFCAETNGGRKQQQSVNR